MALAAEAVAVVEDVGAEAALEMVAVPRGKLLHRKPVMAEAQRGGRQRRELIGRMALSNTARHTIS